MTNWDNMEYVNGEINEVTKELNIKFIPIDNKEFEEIEIDITEIYSSEELIQNINYTEFDKNKYIKIILVR